MIIPDRSTTSRHVLAAAVLLAFAARAEGATLYVAGNGVDGPGCGAKASPCRSITRAIANALPGGKVVVGPGRYGDLDSDGTLGETGEEKPSVGCGCMLSVNKAVSITSSQGAAATVIDARSVVAGTNVLIVTDGGEFGRPARGFTVTNSAGGSGIVLDATNVSVRGNQVVSDGSDPVGIDTVSSPGIVRIEGNQVIGAWQTGIRAQGTGKTVRRNVVSLAMTGIASFGNSTITGNITVANSTGFFLNGTGAVVGNAAVGSRASGCLVTTTNGLIFEKNNLFGNQSCGVIYNPVIVGALLAQNNYWGAATGPGPDPADSACVAGGSMTVDPFATKAVAVKVPIKP